MTYIDSLLPLLDSESWRWNTQSESNTTLGAEGNVRLYESSSGVGWFYWGLVTIDGNAGPDTTIDITNGRLSVNSTIEEFYENGVTDRGPGAPSLNRYDTQDNTFGVLYEPRPPLAFNDQLTITLEGAENDSVLVTSDMLELEILDEQRFVGSLREVLFSSVNQNLTDVNNNLATMSRQIAQTNNLLSSLLQGDTITEIAQGETVGEEDLDEGEVAQRVGSILGQQGTAGRGSREGQGEDRDEDLTTLGK